MGNEEKEVLSLFQCDRVRYKEEDFAHTFTENKDIRIFFINENHSFTDGRNIIIDPAYERLFYDERALYLTEKQLKLDYVISQQHWYALSMITRALNLHELLHIIYSNLGSSILKDVAVTKSERQLLGIINSIVEDAFVEAAGCSEYDNMSKYIIWMRILVAHKVNRNKKIADSLLDGLEVKDSGNNSNMWNLKEDKASKKLISDLKDVLGYMVNKYLYNMMIQMEVPDYIKEISGEIIPLFDSAVIESRADIRDEFCIAIFKVLKELLPNGEEFDFSEIDRLLYGSKTHVNYKSSIKNVIREGKTLPLRRKVFTDLEGQSLDITKISSMIELEFKDLEREKNGVFDLVEYTGSQVWLRADEFDCDPIHEHIDIKITNPKINLNLKRAYDNIVNNYRLSINNYVNKIDRILKQHLEQREEKQLFGSGISSKNFSDIKKRYWYKKVEEEQMPDLSVMLLIDGSSSMAGERREYAIISSIILHEVLSRINIPHTVVEHRAIYGQPVVTHNILLDFDSKKEEKYNLLALKSEEGTREGLSLYWAEKYMAKSSNSDTKLIVMISDGCPAHKVSKTDIYFPPVSTKDTFTAARKINKRGTKIVAVALDEVGSDECYTMLKNIYPAVVACTDLSKLTGQLLAIFSKELEK